MATMDRERDGIMVKNIIQFIHSTKARKVVILTGLLHKPFLIDGLGALTVRDQLELEEYFDL
jgi:hypothetical protein